MYKCLFCGTRSETKYCTFICSVNYTLNQGGKVTMLNDDIFNIIRTNYIPPTIKREDLINKTKPMDDKNAKKSMSSRGKTSFRGASSRGLVTKTFIDETRSRDSSKTQKSRSDISEWRKKA